MENRDKNEIVWQGRPTLARFEQFWSDAFNALCCTGYLALGACVDSDGMIGIRPNNLPTVIRDIHAKCNELLICLLLRGTPLKELYQVFLNILIYHKWYLELF